MSHFIAIGYYVEMFFAPETDISSWSERLSRSLWSVGRVSSDLSGTGEEREEVEAVFFAS